MSLLLHSYWRSTAPYRVRIGLALKGLAFDLAPVNLLAGEQRAEPYRGGINPQGLVPALEADGRLLTQSLAILEWLDEAHPEPPLLPADPFDRAVVRAMAAIVACDIHPLNNLRVLQALAALGHPMGGEEQTAWGKRWIGDGLAALEGMVSRHGAGFCFGPTPTLADCLVIPQLWAANRFDVDIADYPALSRAYASASTHPAFQSVHPDHQPDKPAA